MALVVVAVGVAAPGNTGSGLSLIFLPGVGEDDKCPFMREGSVSVLEGGVALGRSHMDSLVCGL